MNSSSPHVSHGLAVTHLPHRLASVAFALVRVILATLSAGVRGLFNLNDSRWGRGPEAQGNEPARNQGSGSPKARSNCQMAPKSRPVRVQNASDAP